MDLFTEASLNPKIEPHLDIEMDDFIVSTSYCSFISIIYIKLRQIFEYKQNGI